MSTITSWIFDEPGQAQWAEEWESFGFSVSQKTPPAACCGRQITDVQIGNRTCLVCHKCKTVYPLSLTAEDEGKLDAEGKYLTPSQMRRKAFGGSGNRGGGRKKKGDSDDDNHQQKGSQEIPSQLELPL